MVELQFRYNSLLSNNLKWSNWKQTKYFPSQKGIHTSSEHVKFNPHVLKLVRLMDKTLKIGHPRPLFRLFSVFFKQTSIQFYNKLMWKNVHQVYEIPGSNQDVSNLLLYRKDENTEKEVGNGTFKNIFSSFL